MKRKVYTDRSWFYFELWNHDDFECAKKIIKSEVFK